MNYIAALIAEHGGLEEAARKDKVLKDTLATCTGGRPLTEFLFERFLQFSKVATDQTLPILCLCESILCDYADGSGDLPQDAAADPASRRGEVDGYHWLLLKHGEPRSPSCAASRFSQVRGEATCAG